MSFAWRSKTIDLRDNYVNIEIRILQMAFGLSFCCISSGIERLVTHSIGQNILCKQCKDICFRPDLDILSKFTQVSSLHGDAITLTLTFSWILYAMAYEKF